MNQLEAIRTWWRWHWNTHAQVWLWWLQPPPPRPCQLSHYHVLNYHNHWPPRPLTSTCTTSNTHSSPSPRMPSPHDVCPMSNPHPPQPYALEMKCDSATTTRQCMQPMVLCCLHQWHDGATTTQWWWQRQHVDGNMTTMRGYINNGACRWRRQGRRWQWYEDSSDMAQWATTGRRMQGDQRWQQRQLTVRNGPHCGNNGNGNSHDHDEATHTVLNAVVLLPSTTWQSEGGQGQWASWVVEGTVVRTACSY